MLRFLYTILFLFLSQSLFSKSSPTYINVGTAQTKKSQLAFPKLRYTGPPAKSQYLKYGEKIYSVIYNDLTISSFFTFVNPKAFLEKTEKTSLKPAPIEPNGFQFGNWSAIGADFLIQAGYKVENKQIKLETYLYYVPHAKLVLGKSYSGPTSTLRKLAHTFSNDVVKALTGKPSFFTTKIVVASNKRSGNHKEIWVMDWDGANAKKVTNHKTVAISPSWGPKGKKIAYTAFAFHKKAKTRNADLFFYELNTGKRWLVSYRKGINSGSVFPPSGKYALLTLSNMGNPDIYRMSLDGKRISPLTRGPNGAMNVEPDVSSDGKLVAFSSDRSGKPNIYYMKINGTGVKKVTFAGHYNSSPSWSPDNNTIAFAGFDKGHFDIFTIKKNGTNIKRLTNAKKKNGKPANNESPTFSPDGRHIMFVSDRDGNKQLYIVNADGTNERRITVDSYSYFKPKWGPLLD